MSEPDRLLTFLRGSRGARGFRPGPVPEEALAAVLEVARQSGSSGNRQPWHFVAVRAPATLRQLARLVPNATRLERAPLAIVIVMPGGQVALDAFDEGRVTERILLAARAEGLAGAIGWVLAEERDAVRELLGIPPERLVRTTVSLGYPADEAPPSRGPGGRERRPLSAIVHLEGW